MNIDFAHNRTIIVDWTDSEKELTWISGDVDYYYKATLPPGGSISLTLNDYDAAEQVIGDRLSDENMYDGTIDAAIKLYDESGTFVTSEITYIGEDDTYTNTYNEIDDNFITGDYNGIIVHTEITGGGDINMSNYSEGLILTNSTDAEKILYLEVAPYPEISYEGEFNVEIPDYFNLVTNITRQSNPAIGNKHKSDITTRSSKGDVLTHAELDNNFIAANATNFLVKSDNDNDYTPQVVVAKHEPGSKTLVLNVEYSSVFTNAPVGYATVNIYNRNMLSTNGYSLAVMSTTTNVLDINTVLDYSSGFNLIRIIGEYNMNTTIAGILSVAKTYTVDSLATPHVPISGGK